MNIRFCWVSSKQSQIHIQRKKERLLSKSTETLFEKTLFSTSQSDPVTVSVTVHPVPCTQTSEVREKCLDCLIPQKGSVFLSLSAPCRYPWSFSYSITVSYSVPACHEIQTFQNLKISPKYWGSFSHIMYELNIVYLWMNDYKHSQSLKKAREREKKYSDKPLPLRGIQFLAEHFSKRFNWMRSVLFIASQWHRCCVKVVLIKFLLKNSTSQNISFFFSSVQMCIQTLRHTYTAKDRHTHVH